MTQRVVSVYGNVMMQRKSLALALLVLLLPFLLGANCDPGSKPTYKIQIRAVLMADTDGTRSVYSGYDRTRLLDGIEQWVSVTNEVFSRDANIQVAFDRNTDAVDMNNTLLNWLSAGPEELYNADRCQGMCIERGSDGKCTKQRLCSARNPDRSCKTSSDLAVSFEPGCDIIFAASWEAADSLAEKHPDRVVVIFRYGPNAWKTGGGFSFPALDHKFVAMPDFWSTFVKIYDYDAQALESAVNCSAAPAFTARCRDQNDGWLVAQNQVLFAHELGHYLGLSHTFPGAYWDTDSSRWVALDRRGHIADALARAAGSASVFDTDGVADTNPDPGVGMYLNDTDKRVDPCNGSFAGDTGTSPKGLDYAFLFYPSEVTISTVGNFRDGTPANYSVKVRPPRENAMSYFVCGMMPPSYNEIPLGDEVALVTTGQANRMRAALRNQRKNVLCANPANLDLSVCKGQAGGATVALALIAAEEGLDEGVIEEERRNTRLRPEATTRLALRKIMGHRPAAALGCDND